MCNYDVVIFGGGTAGCACAWNCGKLGLKTLLIEKESYLGGSITGSLVIPVMKSGDNQINTDFYNELVKQMNKAGGQITYQGNSGWFNPFVMKSVLADMLSSVGVEVAYNLPLSRISNIRIAHAEIQSSPSRNDDKLLLSVCSDKVYTDNTHILGIDILSEYIEAKYFVDATGDLNICEQIGCEFLSGPNEPQPMSLRFIMDNIDLKTFGDWLLQTDNNREVTTVEHIDGQTHLSTAYTWDSDKHWALAPYFDKAVEEGVLKDTDRNYFQVFTVAGLEGGLAFNCPRIISTNDREKAYKLGTEAIYRIADFCIKYFPGFKNAKILKIADIIGVRASRQIRGKYIYTIEDLRSGKKFEHPAVISNYPVDVHSKNKDASTLEITGEYQLPIESLMSADYDNLFVIGRGLSADTLAQGALRVQASCFSMGEAVAKYIIQHPLSHL